MRTSLARHLGGPAPLDEREVRRGFVAAWHKLGVAALKPEDGANDYERQAIRNAAERKYGRREPHGE